MHIYKSACKALTCSILGNYICSSYFAVLPHNTPAYLIQITLISQGRAWWPLLLLDPCCCCRSSVLAPSTVALQLTSVPSRSNEEEAPPPRSDSVSMRAVTLSVTLLRTRWLLGCPSSRGERPLGVPLQTTVRSRAPPQAQE